MTNSLKIFDYKGSQIRTVILNGEPWWVAKDVCDILGHSNCRMAVDRLDDDEKGVSIIDTPGGPQEMLIVNEPGLYSLILGSRKPEAKEFKRWITHEVIPAIRKTGIYCISTPITPTEALLQAVQILVNQEKQLRALEEKVAIANHRIDNLDHVNVIGDPQQRLNAMVRKYAHQEGITFSKAWREFKQAYNTAFRTNITLLIENASMKHGKKLTIPQYLAMTGKLEDAIRVVDKMLNRQQSQANTYA